MSNIVQYIVIRSDLLKEKNWTIGAAIAQSCHAVTAVLHRFYDDEHVKAYLNDLENMHKVVLDVNSENNILKLQDSLKENNIKYHLWIEQPENIPTCLAVKPYPKSEVQRLFSKLKLLKI